MNFEEAVKCIDSGRSVRRLSWSAETKLVSLDMTPVLNALILEGENYVIQKRAYGHVNQTGKIYVNWIPAYKDIIATDWIVL